MSTLLFMALGTAASVVGQISAGRSAKKAADYNAAIYERQAAQSRERGKLNAKRVRQKNRRIFGANLAAAGKNGLSSVSSLQDVVADNASQGELDALLAEYDGNINASNLQAQASSERFRGRQARNASYAKALGTGLSGFSSYRSESSRLNDLKSEKK